jgi:hypothetical protein
LLEVFGADVIADVAGFLAGADFLAGAGFLVAGGFLAGAGFLVAGAGVATTGDTTGTSAAETAVITVSTFIGSAGTGASTLYGTGVPSSACTGSDFLPVKNSLIAFNIYFSYKQIMCNVI